MNNVTKNPQQCYTLNQFVERSTLNEDNTVSIQLKINVSWKIFDHITCRVLQNICSQSELVTVCHNRRTETLVDTRFHQQTSSNKGGRFNAYKTFWILR